MSQKRKEQAIGFARENGFDGVIPIGYGCFRPGDVPSGIPDGCDWYEAGCFSSMGGDGDPSWHPIFDSKLHIIIVDDEGARWRSDADALRLNR